MAKAIVRIAAVAAVAAILVSLVSPIVYAEAEAAARSEKWRCNRLTCKAYDAQGRKTGKFVFYGTVINVTWRNNTWLRFDLNSAVYRYYYLIREFEYVK